MDIAQLNPILNKESILKTANARELGQAPQDVLHRYQSYALTHIPLGNTTGQLTNLQRVITQNKHCAVGTIVGPYGYGKTSTAVHLWNELRSKEILSIPPFQWNTLKELLDAVYHWIRFEFSLGPTGYLEPLETIYEAFRDHSLIDLEKRLDQETVRQLNKEGFLQLGMRAEDFVIFCSQASDLCQQAGYRGLAIFTDELQVTLAAYQPSRDQFYADLFQIVKDILGLAGQWTLVLTMDDGTEGIIAQDRADMLQRMQKSALYFRVRDVYNRREYPAELWSAFEERFGFDGSNVLPSATLEAIGQIAARSDLGAGPRMVTHAFSLAVKHFGKTNNPYSPIQFVDDFLTGQMVFDQRGKFVAGVTKALQNSEIKISEPYQQVVKLLAAYPMGCPEEILERFGLLGSFRTFPPLARQELIFQVAGGYSLRYLAEEEIEPEQIEQRLAKSFFSRFNVSRKFAERAAEGFLRNVLLEPTFDSWKGTGVRQVNIDGTYFSLMTFMGTFDSRYPDRRVAITVAALPQSGRPAWRKVDPDSEMEFRFELNYQIAPSEPNRILISLDRPEVAIYQLNLTRIDREAATKILPDFLLEHYAPESLTPLLALALIDHLSSNSGERPDDQMRISALLNPLRQFTLTLLLNEVVETIPPEFASRMVGTEQIKDLFRQMVRSLFPDYVTLNTGRRWKENLQQYNFALQSVASEDGLSITRGRRPWNTTKEQVADTLRIPGRKLTNLESLLDVLDPLIIKEDFSGRQPNSPVVLRFGLHPLEENWLAKLDTSSETVFLDGIRVPALPAEELIRDARSKGYTPDEIEEVLRLLQNRKYVDWNSHKNLLIRTVDDVTDLRDAVLEQVNQLQGQVRQLSESVPDFDAGFYPVETLRSQLMAASERDEYEDIRAQVRQYSSKLSLYSHNRIAASQDRLKQEQDKLFTIIRKGVPSWLSEEMPTGPFYDLLEKQRGFHVSSYEEALAELTTLRNESISTVRDVANDATAAVARLGEILRKLVKEGEVLLRRLQGLDDRKEDFEQWRKLCGYVNVLSKKTLDVQKKYDHSDFTEQASQMWHAMQEKMETQPLSALGQYRVFAREISDLNTRMNEWIASRRSDFELLCQEYQESLSAAGIDTDLSIPFDSENPTESYAALGRLVQRQVSRHLDMLSAKLKREHQIIRYAVQVQNLDMGGASDHAEAALTAISALQQAMSDVRVDDLTELNSRILAPLAQTVDMERQVSQITQRSLTRRVPEGKEEELMTILRRNAGQGQIDLRGLIISLLDDANGYSDLNDLMRILQSLFQKNQIALAISILEKA